MQRLPTIAELHMGVLNLQEVEYTELPKITYRQQKFVDEYVRCGNASVAAIRSGYSHGSAGSMVHEPNVKMHIMWHRSKIADAYDISKESLLRELGKIIGANLDDFLTLDEHGNKVWDFSMVQREHMASVAEFSTEETKFGKKTKIKLHDKLAAIEKVAKMLGYNEPDKVQTLNMNANVDVAMSPAEAAEAWRRVREGA